MKFQPTNQTKALQQLRWLSRQINQLIDTRRFESLQQDTQHALVQRLRTLYTRVATISPSRRLQRMLGAAALFLGIGLSPALAQVPFAPVVRNPYSLQPASDIEFATMVDVDSDGDLDIVSVPYYGAASGILFYRNAGTAQQPAFEAPQSLPAAWNVTLPSLSEDDGFTTADFADLDGDGDLDLLLGSYQYYNTGKIYFFENTGTAQAPNYGAPQENPFGLNAGSSFVVAPKMVDIDDDGDLDLFSIRYDADLEDNTGILFQRNIGSPQAPAFSPVEINPFGFSLSNQLPFMDFGDIDGDGDLDMMAGGALAYGGDLPQLSFLRNTGTAAAPDFSGVPADAPFGFEVPAISPLLQPLVGDLDGDGDTDIMVGGIYNNETYGMDWYYLQNLLNPTSVPELTAVAEVRLYPTVSTESVQLEVKALQEQAFFQLDILDVKGQLVSSRREQANQQLSVNIPVQQLEAGSYFLRITTDQGLAVTRFIKQ